MRWTQEYGAADVEGGADPGIWLRRPPRGSVMGARIRAQGCVGLRGAPCDVPSGTSQSPSSAACPCIPAARPWGRTGSGADRHLPPGSFWPLLLHRAASTGGADRHGCLPPSFAVGCSWFPGSTFPGGADRHQCLPPPGRPAMRERREHQPHHRWGVARATLLYRGGDAMIGGGMGEVGWRCCR